ncbi:XRE family transcriptional regulator [Alistipes timonensis]|uniref:XRE family transcriptional regulator n=1 Tax=Alistipes timonensis TaxID=1465754 RepID=UPI0020CD472E|nr:S24 family peptidase [Alistipes timonensis]MCR2030787.1 helix-turn-helix domain-containing protein [Alistipes timonensis]
MDGTIHERIERLVKEFGGGKNTVLADKIGVSEGNIRGYIKGIMPKYDVLEKIVTSLDVNPDWLLTGRGNMEKEPNLQQAGMQVQEKFPLKTDNLVALQRIPLYNLEATAGLVSLFNDVDAIPISYISLPDLPTCDGAVYVRGDSMYPLLKSGDIVLYKQVHDMQYGIFWGEMYLVSANVDGDEFVTIKYIHKSEWENCVKLVSHNQHHEPKDIPVSMIRALALVKASVRYNTIR